MLSAPATNECVSIVIAAVSWRKVRYSAWHYSIHLDWFDIFMPDSAPSTAFPCCFQAPPPRVREGVALFNRGAFFECHEVLEDAWREEPGPCRFLYQGILQLGVAFYHIQQGNRPGALKVLKRAAAKFDRLPDRCQEVDVARLRWVCESYGERLGRADWASIKDFPRIEIEG